MAKSLIILIISMLSKLLGFMREVLLAYFYGAGEITDIYCLYMGVKTLAFRSTPYRQV